MYFNLFRDPTDPTDINLVLVCYYKDQFLCYISPDDDQSILIETSSCNL